MGNATSIVTKVLIQSIVILIVGLIMGARMSDHPLGWVGGVLLIACYGIGFSGFALTVASSTDSSEGYHMMIFLLQLPLLFLSNSLYPMSTLPTWMQIGAYANPNYICGHLGCAKSLWAWLRQLGPVADISLVALFYCFRDICGIRNVHCFDLVQEAIIQSLEAFRVLFGIGNTHVI